MKLGHDIWLELTNMLADNGENQNLLALALTSQTMSTLALPALWKSIHSCDRILSLINSHSQDDDKYVDREPGEHETGSMNYWASDYLYLHFIYALADLDHVDVTQVLSKPIPEYICSRAIEYFSHVRSYSESNWNMDNEALRLLSLLPGWLRLNGPLFPHLQYLIFHVSYPLGPQIDSFGSLLPPTVRSLHLHIDTWPMDDPDVRSATTIPQLAAHQGCDLYDFQYSGGLCSSIHSSVVDFKNLRILHILISTDNPLESRPTISVFDFLSSLTNLTSFYCDAQAYAIPSSGKSSSGIPRHETLTDLDIYGESHDIERLLTGMKFPLLLDLRFVVTRGTFARRMKHLNRKIVSHSPMIRRLRITLNPRFGVRPTFDDLTPLFSPQLKSFHFPVDERFTLVDMANLLDACPHLHTLQLTSEMKHNAVDMFSILSRHPELRECTIPVDFGHHQLPRPGLQSKSRLEKLSFDLAANIPTTSLKIEECAKHFLHTFSSIYSVSARYKDDFAKQLEAVILRLKKEKDR